MKRINFKNLKVGKRFKIDGKTYEVKEFKFEDRNMFKPEECCFECAFYKKDSSPCFLNNNKLPNCVASLRKDKKHVVFVEVRDDDNKSTILNTFTKCWEEVVKNNNTPRIKEEEVKMIQEMTQKGIDACNNKHSKQHNNYYLVNLIDFNVENPHNYNELIVSEKVLSYEDIQQKFIDKKIIKIEILNKIKEN